MPCEPRTERAVSSICSSVDHSLLIFKCSQCFIFAGASTSQGLVLKATPSKGSAAVSRRSTLAQLLNTLREADIAISIGDFNVSHEVHGDEVVNAFMQCSIDDYKATVETINTNGTQRGRKVAKKHLSKLRPLLGESTSEGDAQKVLTDAAEELGGMDTHKLRSSFCMPQTVGRHHNVYKANAKIDFTMRDGPVHIELKASKAISVDVNGDLVDADFEVIQQAVERAFVARCTDAALCAFVVLAVSDRSAWEVQFQRTLENYQTSREKDSNTKDKHFEQILIHRIDHDDIHKLWCGYQGMSKKKPLWYLTKDGTVLRSTLRCLTAEPRLCLSQLISSSRHNVYGITLPNIYDSLDGRGHTIVTCGVTAIRHDLAVKVLQTIGEFQLEAPVAAAVCGEYNSDNGPHHHVLGVHGVADDPVDDAVEADDLAHLAELFDESATLEAAGVKDGLEKADEIIKTQRFLIHIKSRLQSTVFRRQPLGTTDACKWTHFQDSTVPGACGGAIVMRVGTPVTLSMNTLDSWLAGVMKTLRAVHKAGYFHCDIRPKNVMMFPDGCQLIDHDLAVRQTANIFKLEPGGQYDMRGISLAAVTTEEDELPVKWTSMLDGEMVIACVVQFVREMLVKK